MGQLAEFVTHHPFYILGLFAALGAALTYELRLKSQNVSQVSATDAVRLINRGAIIVDVRSAEAYQSGHIVNSRHMALSELEGDGKVITKQKGKILLTVCDHGNTSARAAKLLRRAGYENAFSLQGGIAGWRAENLPLVK